MIRKSFGERVSEMRYAIQARLEIPAKKRWLKQNGYANENGRSWFDRNDRIAVIDSQVKELTLYDLQMTAEHRNTNQKEGGLLG